MMNSNPGDRMPSDPIAAEKVTIDRKVFFLDLKENQRGRFLKITEDVGGRRDTIMLPAPANRGKLSKAGKGQIRGISLTNFTSRLRVICLRQERPMTAV